MAEWNNYGDANFTEYGGIMVKQDEERTDDYHFFQVIVGEENDKYAFAGVICDISEYADNETLSESAGNFGYASAEDFIKAEPERAVTELLENYGYGAMEFSARNHEGTGQYSLNMKDFEVTDAELIEFMKSEGLPESFLPDLNYEVTARYGEAGVEDTLKTNDWEEVEKFSHEKLSDGLSVEIKDVKSGETAELDPDKYMESFDNRGGEFPVDNRDMSVDYGENNDYEMD